MFLETLYIIVPAAIGFYLAYWSLKKANNLVEKSVFDRTDLSAKGVIEPVITPTRDLVQQQFPEKEPIKWKSLIPENPTLEQFLKAWGLIFEKRISNCKIELFADDFNAGFKVHTSHGSIMDGGFGEHTDTPKLDDKSLIWSRGGCSWSTDKEGIRYYYINKKTLLPWDWEKVQAKEIIKNYLKANWKKGIATLGGLHVSQNNLLNN